MPDPDRKFWFHVKSYGFGWGMPARWQGWVSILVYLGLLLAAVCFATPTARWIYVAVLTTLFIILVAFTGERPARWRWGKD